MSLTDRLRTERDEALELADSGVEAAAELREFASLMGEAMLEIARLESLLESGRRGFLGAV